MNEKSKTFLIILTKSGTETSVSLKRIAKNSGMQKPDVKTMALLLQEGGYVKMLGSWCRVTPKGIRYITAFEQKGNASSLRAHDVRKLFRPKERRREAEDIKGKPLTELCHISRETMRLLQERNIETIGDVAQAHPLRIVEDTKLPFADVAKVINEARIRLGWHTREKLEA